MERYNVKNIDTSAKIKNASLCIAGSNPLVTNINSTSVKSDFLSIHHIFLPKTIATLNNKAPMIRKISFVSK